MTHNNKRKLFWKLGKFRKGDSRSGFVAKFYKSGGDNFVLHSRTQSGINKIIKYFKSKNWKVS